MDAVLMTGNEAVARGAYEGGCTVAAAYPGTPSTEILENVAKYKPINSRWASNEKVALEIAAGAAIGGSRALAAMKHVGLNVAADPLFTMGYEGVNGGLVIVSADEPGCHSSQNEQDNRLYAPHAKLAMVEPSDSQECKDFVKTAYEISEQFDIPVLLRMTTRICHSKSIVALDDRQGDTVKNYVKNPNKYAVLPPVARARHIDREKSLIMLEEYACKSPLNRIEWGGKKIGIIASGISYQYAREVFGNDASYLKLGLTHPLPTRLIDDFASEVEELYVIEENEPYIENKVKMMGLKCTGKDKLPICGELSTGIIRKALKNEHPKKYSVDVTAPVRKPVFCAGCSHRGFFHSIHKHRKDLVGVGDIGCYGLGVAEPFEGFDYLICMGASISSAMGLAESLKRQGDKRKVFGMLGDSTFFHSGITGLIDVVHFNSNVCVCILDNSITAMTGHQETPGTEKGLMGESVKPINLVNIVNATGIGEDRIRIVDPINQKEMDAAVEAAIAMEGSFVIVAKSPCVMLKEVARKNAAKTCIVDQDKCRNCKACLKIACPSLYYKDGKVVIDSLSCTACGLCMQLCKFDAIEKAGE